MAWAKTGNIKGPKGDKGDKGDQGAQGWEGTLVGTIILWPSESIPVDYLACNGSNQLIADYPDLYAVLGTRFGPGDGSTTFTLPDFRGRAAIGYGLGAGLTNRTIGAKGGEEAHALSWAENGPHYHNISVSDPTHNHGFNDPQHQHPTYDPSHAHGLPDPGHAHIGGVHNHLISDHAHNTYYHSIFGGHTWGGGAGLSYGGAWAGSAGCGDFWARDGYGGVWTDSRGTGMGCNGAYTGVVANWTTTRCYNSASGTGISASSDTQGSGTAHNNMSPYLVANYIIRSTASSPRGILIPDAPVDGQLYGRKDDAWEIIPGAGAAIEVATKRYVDAQVLPLAIKQYIDDQIAALRTELMTEINKKVNKTIFP